MRARDSLLPQRFGLIKADITERSKPNRSAHQVCACISSGITTGIQVRIALALLDHDRFNEPSAVSPRV